MKLLGNNRPIDADAQSYITAWETAAGTSMSFQIKQAFNSFVSALKADNLWTKFDTGDMAPIYGGTAATAAVCIKGTTLTFVNSPTINQTGVDWNASTQYAQTGWIPSVSASATSVHVAYYSGENSLSSARFDMGANNGSSWLALRLSISTGNSIGYGYSATVSAASANSDYSGLFVVSKESNTKIFLQRNGSTLNVNTSTNSVAAPTVQVYLGAYNANGTATSHTNRECRFSSWGAGMTEAEATTYNAIVENLMDALGRGLQ